MCLLTLWILSFLICHPHEPLEVLSANASFSGTVAAAVTVYSVPQLGSCEIHHNNTDKIMQHNFSHAAELQLGQLVSQSFSTAYSIVGHGGAGANLQQSMS
ncbi:hypothetical protein AMECASPLE_024375 [Ameca splendens]|uniref:Uncharacterized protein n=1 Tax=Ameca splendens TaxID=208324 RepID=A0ABV0Z2M0_9TELE